MIALIFALSAWALGLDEVREIAVREAVEVEMSEARVDAARADAWVATGQALPSVAGFVDLSAGAGMTSFGFERPTRTVLGIGVSARWQVVDPATWAAAAAARGSARGQEAMLRWTRSEARRQATSAYAQALAAEEVRRAWAGAALDAEEARSAVEALVGAGLRPSADLSMARADAARIRARLAWAEAEQAARCAALQGLLRQEVDGRCELVPVDWGPPAPGPGRHPALDAAQEALAVARAQRTASTWALAPTAEAWASRARYEVGGADGGPAWNAGVGVDVPLAAGGAGHSARSAERARVREAEVELEAQERTLAVARFAAEARLGAARTSVEALRESQQAAEVALRDVDERYQAGLEGVITWLAARRARDEASVGLAEAGAVVGEALAEVESARGVW